VAGTWTALLLARAGRPVALHEAGDETLSGATSFWAGGMLAPDCESEGAEPLVVRLGRRSLEIWREHMPDTALDGSLVVAHPRDEPDLNRFARQTSGHERVDAARLSELEPLLAGRFRSALFFPDEGHVEPRLVLPRLRAKLAQAGGEIRFGSRVEPDALEGEVVDCRGLSARAALPELRGVRGEVVLVETDEVKLNRPVRLMHPRWPLYVVPRANNRFLIGATTIESEREGAVSVRSALELLTAAYTLHPAFGEARIIEMGSALRPAFPDHAPRIEVRGRRIAVNGLYRHGFLMAPALAEIVADYVISGKRDNEVMRWSSP
jgi:glycine oxidase